MRAGGALAALLLAAGAASAGDDAAPAAAPAAAAPPVALELARAATAEFGGTLKQTLQASLTERGPVATIGVCADKAPEIAEVVGEQLGVRVTRTSTRHRNPANAPTDWQRTVLADWDGAIAAGADAAGLEFFEQLQGDGFRYMKPIVTAPLCVTCHGAALDPALARAIAQRYPGDLATGYAPGELRGAFVVTSVGARAP